MCLPLANRANWATVSTAPSISHWNGPKWAQRNQTGPKSEVKPSYLGAHVPELYPKTESQVMLRASEGSGIVMPSHKLATSTQSLFFSLPLPRHHYSLGQPTEPVMLWKSTSEFHQNCLESAALPRLNIHVQSYLFQSLVLSQPTTNQKNLWSITNSLN